MHVDAYLTLLRASERELARGFAVTARHHSEDPDIAPVSASFARECEARLRQLAPLVSRYGAKAPPLPDAFELTVLRATLFHGGRSGLLGILRDMQNLWLLAHRVQLLALLLRDTGAALRDKELMDVCSGLQEQTGGQIAWLQSRVKEDGAQIVITAPTASPVRNAPWGLARAWTLQALRPNKRL